MGSQGLTDQTTQDHATPNHKCAGLTLRRMADTRPSALLNLPNELIQAIFACLSAQDLSQNVQMTCKKLNDLTFPVYRNRYGRGPTPVAQHTQASWKVFALRNEEYEKDEDGLRNITLDEFLAFYLTQPNDETLQNSAESVLYYLHENPQIHSRGMEAVIAALNVQHRPEEFKKLQAEYNISLDSKALLQARFNLSFRVSWPDCSAEILNHCLLAAAAGGNIGLFEHLTTLVLEKCEDLETHGVAIAAAKSGTVGILQWLHTSPIVDFGNLPLDLMIEEAARYDRANAIEFLLNLGVPTDLENTYEFALRFGNINVLHQLAKHFPGIAKTSFRDGRLQIAFVLANGHNIFETIGFLVQHASVDINAIGEDGLAAVHIAAERGFIDVLKLLETKGANMMSSGNIEQTPAEIAYCNGHRISLPSLLTLSPEFLNIKREKARAILGKSRGNVIQCFATKEECFNIHSAYDEAECKLADLWARKIGFETLGHLHNMLETPMYDAVENFRGIILEYASHPMAQTEEGEEEERSAICVIKVILKKFLDRPYAGDFLENLGHYAIRRLSRPDVEHLTDFVTRTGNVLHLRKWSFANDEDKIWEEFRDKIGRQ